MIYVKFFGPFEPLMPQKNAAGFWEADWAGKTINEALQNTDFGNTKFNVLVNNVRADKDYVLQDGDKLGVMPLLAGG